MTSCCEKKSCDLEQMSREQSRVLWAVLAINLVMFGVEIVGGIVAGSLSLLGDSLDMLGDAVTYGASLYVINQGLAAKARVAILKAGIILLSGVSVLGAAIYRVIYRETPSFDIMATVGLAALAANLVCLVLLTRRRKDDINMASVWLCSRNDIIANVSVLIGAGLVLLTKTPWPDIAIGMALMVLFLTSAYRVFGDARIELGKSRSLNLSTASGQRN